MVPQPRASGCYGCWSGAAGIRLNVQSLCAESKVRDCHFATLFLSLDEGKELNFSYAPSFLASLFFSPPLFLVEVRFPAAAEFAVAGLRTAAPRAFLVEEGAAATFSCFSSPEVTPFVGESGESEVLIRFESCFGLPQYQPSHFAFKRLLFRYSSKNSLVRSLASAPFTSSRASSSRGTP